MRLVIDTNIFVSSALKINSVPALAIQLAERGHKLLKSNDTEAQLFEVLARPRLASLVSPVAVLNFQMMLAIAELVTIKERIAACRDPTDDKFLDLAVNGKADMIISGDADLLVLHPFRGIPIVTAATFVRDGI